MLFEPFKEQFNLPAGVIQLSNRQGRHGEVVGQKDEFLARFWIAITDAAQHVGIMALWVKADGHHGLVKTQPGGFVHRTGIKTSATEVFLSSGDKEGGAQVEAMPACEVQPVRFSGYKLLGDGRHP